MSVELKLKKARDAFLQGRLEEAEALYDYVLQRKPRDVVALHHIGLIYYNRGDFDAAIDRLKKSVSIKNHNSSAHYTLALALRAKGEFSEAIDAFQQSLALNPRNEDCLNDLAVTFLSQNLVEESISILLRLIEIRPNSFLAYYNLGVAFQKQRNLLGAVEAFQQAIVINPNFPEACCNLGLAFTDQGRLDEANVAYRNAIKLKPNFPVAFNNLSRSLADQWKLDEASVAVQQAITLDPSYTDALHNLASIQRKQGYLQQAVDTWRRELEVDPNSTRARIQLINLRRYLCDWREFDAETQQLIELVDVVEPFILLNAPSTPAQQLRCARNWAAKQHRGEAFNHVAARPPGKIRIGYLSADFRRHATAYLMAELFERHDRSRFELFAYSYGYDDNSDVRQRLINAFDHFVELQSASHAAAAQRIYDDNIDILVDLKGYTGDSRSEILNYRPAPIQVNYLGYPGTMGSDFVDYIIADSSITPIHDQLFYAEKIVNLPHSYQPNDTKRLISPDTPTRSEYGLPDQGFVFCSFNAFYKISPVFFDVWMRLLKATPGSVLWLLSSSPLAEDNLRREAAARGVEAQRLVFCTGLPIAEHLARHRLADLFLDTLPINAHTTASDALWAGLPVLTCRGDTFAGRVAGSLLQAVGLPELIAASIADYEAKALDLATNPQRLADLKSKLARNLPESPLFDISDFTLGLESAYVEMWNVWQAGESPKAFSVGAMQPAGTESI